MNKSNHPPAVMSAEAFAMLGGVRIGYAKEFAAEEASRLFPQAPHLAPGLKLWALLAADGTPIMLADTRAALEVNARENDMEMVSVH